MLQAAVKLQVRFLARLTKSLGQRSRRQSSWRTLRGRIRNSPMNQIASFTCCGMHKPANTLRFEKLNLEVSKIAFDSMRMLASSPEGDSKLTRLRLNLRGSVLRRSKIKSDRISHHKGTHCRGTIRQSESASRVDWDAPVPACRVHDCQNGSVTRDGDGMANG